MRDNFREQRRTTEQFRILQGLRCPSPGVETSAYQRGVVRNAAITDLSNQHLQVGRPEPRNLLYHPTSLPPHSY